MTGTEEDHDEPLRAVASPNCTVLDGTPPVTPAFVSSTSKIAAILELLERKPPVTTTTTIPPQKMCAEKNAETNVIDQAEACLESMKRSNDVPVLDDDGKFLERLMKFEQKSDAERLASVHLLKHDSSTLPVTSPSAKLTNKALSSSSLLTVPINNQSSPSSRMQLPYPTVQIRMISDNSVHSIDMDPALDLTSLTDITSVGSAPPFHSHRSVPPRQPYPQSHRQQRQTLPPSSSSRSFQYGSTNPDLRSRVITATTARPSPHPATATLTSANASRNVHVIVRVRPFTMAEQNVASRRVVSYHDNKIVIVNPQGMFDPHPTPPPPPPHRNLFANVLV